MIVGQNVDDFSVVLYAVIYAVIYKYRPNMSIA